MPNISYGPIVVEACKRATDLVLDVHLMIETPDARIPDFAKAGADYIASVPKRHAPIYRDLQLIKV